MSARTSLTRAPERAELDVERAAALLAGCKDIDQVKDLRDRAAAVQVWLRHQRASISAQNDAAEIALRAERRLGELLITAPKAVPGPRPKKIGSETAPISPPTLAEQGLDKKTSARCQKLAAVPETKFEAHVASVRARAEKLTTSGTIAAASHVDGYDSDEFYTPAQYVERARVVLGGIDFDPATCARAQEVVRASRFYTKADDGLRADREWRGRTWMNCPYSAPLVSQFAARLLSSFFDGHIPAAIALFNATTDTAWFQSLASHSMTCLTAGRIAFVTPDGSALEGNRVGQAFFYLGHDPHAFATEFGQYGVVGHLRGSRG